MLPSFSTMWMLAPTVSWIHVGMTHVCSVFWARTQLDVANLQAGQLANRMALSLHTPAVKPWHCLWDSPFLLLSLQIGCCCSAVMVCASQFLTFKSLYFCFLSGRYRGVSQPKEGLADSSGQKRREIGGWPYQDTRTSTGLGKGVCCLVLRDVQTTHRKRGLRFRLLQPYSSQ